MTSWKKNMPGADGGRGGRKVRKRRTEEKNVVVRSRSTALDAVRVQVLVKKSISLRELFCSGFLNVSLCSLLSCNESNWSDTKQPHKSSKMASLSLSFSPSHANSDRVHTPPHTTFTYHLPSLAPLILLSHQHHLLSLASFCCFSRLSCRRFSTHLCKKKNIAYI